MNRGDLFVYEATLRLLDYEYVEEVPISLGDIPDSMYAYYNENFDFLVIRGSNYIRNDGGLGDWLPFFDRLKIPILAFGIGAQSPDRNPKIELSASIVDALRVIADKSVSVGVRGFESAELLSGHGIKNVEAIGCPSIFHELNSKLQVHYAPETVRKVVVTTHPYLGGAYCLDPIKSRRAQLMLISALLREGYEISYLTQGISAETKIVYGCDPASGVAELVSIGWFAEEKDQFYWSYLNGAVCFETADEYFKYSAAHDLNIGVRLHGNITALANGVPAIFIVYDSRTAELARFFNIPHVDEGLIDGSFSFIDFMKSVSFDAFNNSISSKYQNMKNFLEANGIKHRM